MSDYADDINTSDYIYIKPVYVQEIAGTRRTYIPLKFNLNEDNFNFDTILADGRDLRLAEAQNGTGVLTMWTAYWDYTNRRATVWFKLPEIAANQTKTLWAFWGNADDAGISNIRRLLGESPEDVVYTDNLALGASTSGSSAGTITPDNAFDGTNAYCDIEKDGWVQCNFTIPQKINKLTARADGYGWYGYGFELRASNDAFVSEDVLITDVSEVITWPNTGEYFFGNDTEYLNYRIVNDKGQTYWRTQEIELMSLIDESVGGTSAFLFGDDFDVDELNVNKWPVNAGSWSIVDSKINLGADAYIEIDQILGGAVSSPSNFMVEEGIIGVGNPTSTTVYAHRYSFTGGENTLQFRFYWEGSVDRKHDAIETDVMVTYNGVDKGLLPGTYTQNYIGYYEATDRVYQGMVNRENTDYDYEDSWERQVHRNTELTTFRIYGEDSSTAEGVEIDWVIAREFSPETDPTLDISSLLVPHEEVPPQALDFTSYGDDVTSVDFYHSSDVGGDPYRMSDNIVDSQANIWISDTTTTGSLIIDFGRTSTNLVSDEYTHLDNNRVEFYNASKLSNSDEDIHGADWWECTTTSGVWAAIQFPSPIAVGALSVWALESKLGGMMKDYRVYGSNTDPRFATEAEKYLLTEGTFDQTTDEQTVYFDTAGRLLIYYILEVVSTYGDNVALREWAMFEQDTSVGKKAVAQLRLHPVAFDTQEYFYVKNIKLYGSNDYHNWTELFDGKTYTPFYDSNYGRWQRYTLINNDAYYAYKLECVDNWRALTDIMKMAEWEMRERSIEVFNHRILEGSSNNFNNVWADSGTTFDSGNVYMTNDILNVVLDNSLANTEEIVGDIADVNVIV